MWRRRTEQPCYVDDCTERLKFNQCICCFFMLENAFACCKTQVATETEKGSRCSPILMWPSQVVSNVTCGVKRVHYALRVFLPTKLLDNSISHRRWSSSGFVICPRECVFIRHRRHDHAARSMARSSRHGGTGAMALCRRCFGSADDHLMGRDCGICTWSLLAGDMVVPGCGA